MSLCIMQMALLHYRRLERQCTGELGSNLSCEYSPSWLLWEEGTKEASSSRDCPMQAAPLGALRGT